MNKVILIGRLTKDPEVRYSQSAEPIAMAKYTLAVSRRFKRDGEPDADFIPCVALGKAGEFVERFLKKGMQIAVTGRIQVRTYDDQQGQKRWVTEIIVEDQEFTESKASFEGRGGSNAPIASSPSSYSQPTTNNHAQSQASYEPDGFSSITESIEDEDLPF